MTKVAINGFGRIGRLSLRRILESGYDLDVVAINDLVDPEFLAYLFKYDTTFGRFDGEVEATENGIKVNGKEIKVTAEPDANNCPWKELGIDVVVESSGFYTSKEKAQAHINAGAKKVLISAPAKGEGVKMIVFGVNENTLDGSEEIISGASCTTNCLAPMVKVLNDNFGFEVGQMTTIHAYTGNQATLDAPNKANDFRRGRAAALNTVPTTTGAAKAVGKVIPEVEGKIDGSALRVAIGDGSITELYSVLSKKVTVEEVNEAMKNASNEAFLYNEDQIVSSDIVGVRAGSIYDATLTKIVETGDKQLVKTVARYDNEMGYTSNLIRTLNHIANL
ncbi:MAG: type I glyceraldehyde-3-phosphate dehydrogenase [Peptoniphilaceae bacterium]|nr:type I glyceraldehyde-3-phosphate dehydrogenase [Peptoniphilaceae bacterium]MDD7383135.1 type I glyceraldehyde-3-phosphate dehydrogenase [Peptoniphilaceae bacterium]MDY3738134.1 type I glyceraldehyde-3-phosphate dehydrogenase [Peptoniphilaceae bacterium]